MTMKDYEAIEYKLNQLKEIVRWREKAPRCSVESIILQIDLEECFDEIRDLAEGGGGNADYFLKDEVIDRKDETGENLQVEDFKVENWYRNDLSWYIN